DRDVRTVLLARAESLAVAARDTGTLIAARCDKVDNLRTQGRYEDAIRLMHDTQALMRVRPDPRIEATCLQDFTDLELEAESLMRGQTPDLDAVAAMHRAIALLDSLGETSDMLYIGMFSTLAYALEQHGDYRESLAAHRRIMAIMDSTGRGETMDRAVFQHDYALSLLTLGQTAVAERLFHDVLERIGRSDPTGRLPEQPLIHYAHAALFQAHADSAAKYFALLDREGAEDHNAYWEGRALFGLAEAQLQLGRRADAQRTVARFRQVTDTLHITSTDDEVTDPRLLDARLAAFDGDSATAHDLAVQVLRTNGYFDGTRRSIFRSALILAGETALALHRPKEALGYARAVRERAAVDSLTETGSSYIGVARLVEARALLALGDAVGARTSAERALVALRNGAGDAHPRTREAERLVASLH
ncbi:MAG TPA: hypothetical protein VFS15_14465, partial [Kofleriaceae bacterium]|nr:hypothetical protein [Kofleriaceae bacterium]